VSNHFLNVKITFREHFSHFAVMAIVYCYTSCTRQSIVEREGLVDDEHSEERSKGTSSTTCHVQRVQHAIFSTSVSLI
jgi:hypothetical protein